MFQYQYQPGDANKIGFKVLLEGRAQFMITKVLDRDENNYPLKDNSGFPKFLIELKVKDSRGDIGLIEEQFSGSAKASWKIGELLASVGMEQDYNQSGQLDLAKLVGKRGVAEIYVNVYTKRNGSQGKNMKVREFINPNPPQQLPAQQAQQQQYSGYAQQPVQAPPSPPVQAYNQPFAQADNMEDVPF